MNEEILSAVAQMLRAQNIDPAELAEFMVGSENSERTGTTLAKFVEMFLASQDNDGTRGDYRPHLHRLVNFYSDQIHLHRLVKKKHLRQDEEVNLKVHLSF